MQGTKPLSDNALVKLMPTIQPFHANVIARFTVNGKLYKYLSRLNMATSKRNMQCKTILCVHMHV